MQNTVTRQYVRCTHEERRRRAPDGSWYCAECSRRRHGRANKRRSDASWEATRAFASEWGIVTGRDLVRLHGWSMHMACSRLSLWSSWRFPGRLRRVGKGVYALRRMDMWGEYGGEPMSRYRKIDVRMWGDAEFRRLSRPQPNGQSLWQYLLTGPHTSIIPGIYAAREGGLADALGWPLEGFRQAFAEVSRKPYGKALGKPLAKADWDAGLVWIPNAIKHNPPQSPNVIRSWASAWDELPECVLKDEAYTSISEHIESMGKGFREAFGEAIQKPSESLWRSFQKALPNQDQDQDQEEERESAERDGPDGPPELALGHTSEEPKTKTPRKPDEAKLAIKRALAEHIPVPPAISGGPMTKAAERLRGMLKAGKASSLGEAADMLVRAALACGKPFPWCLLDADPLRAPNRPASAMDLSPKLDKGIV